MQSNPSKPMEPYWRSVLAVEVHRLSSTSLWQRNQSIDRFTPSIHSTDLPKTMLDFERKQRGKTDRYRGYRSNSKDWYTKTLIAHGIHNARVIQADAKQLDYTKFAPVAFCFLD